MQVDLINSGPTAGAEVVQLYLGLPGIAGKGLEQGSVVYIL